jgi:signal transduction histidine kinase
VRAAQRNLRRRGAAALGPESTLTLYRVAQEALTNAGKHAPKAPVSVWLSCEAKAVRIRIENGCPDTGTASSLATTGAGLGLIGMRERVQIVGGSLEVGPIEDGWRVTAHIPTS